MRNLNKFVRKSSIFGPYHGLGEQTKNGPSCTVPFDLPGALWRQFKYKKTLIGAILVGGLGVLEAVFYAGTMYAGLNAIKEQGQAHDKDLKEMRSEVRTEIGQVRTEMTQLQLQNCCLQNKVENLDHQAQNIGQDVKAITKEVKAITKFLKVPESP